jgi:hypothetical protein
MYVRLANPSWNGLKLFGMVDLGRQKSNKNAKVCLPQNFEQLENCVMKKVHLEKLKLNL